MIDRNGTAESVIRTWWAPYVSAVGTGGYWQGVSPMNSVDYTFDPISFPFFCSETGWNKVIAGVDQCMTRKDVFWSLGTFADTDEVVAAYPQLRNAEFDAPVEAVYDKYEAVYTDWNGVQTSSLLELRAAILLELGIFKGSSANTLDLNGTLTRAEIATILARLDRCPYVEKDPY